MMKKNPDSLSGNFLLMKLKQFQFPQLGFASGMVCLGSFIAAAFVVVSNMNWGAEGLGDLRDFEAGKVADRDITAEYPLSYVDEEATRLRKEAQEYLVPAVFRYSAVASNEVFESWNEFCDFTDALVAKETSAGQMSAASARLAVQAEYPNFFSAFALDAYFGGAQRAEFRGYGFELLNDVLKKGVFALSAVDMGSYNPDMVELLISLGDRTERERVSLSGIVSMGNVEDAITLAAESVEQNADIPVYFKTLAPSLLAPLIRENVFFSREDTEVRVKEATDRVPPVIKTIEKGKRIVRKGFVITEEDILDLKALSQAFPKRDPRSVIGLVLLLMLLYALFIFLQGTFILNRDISVQERCLLFALVFLYLAGAGLTKNLVSPLSSLPASLFFPTALMVMIPAVFMGPLLAFVMALVFPLGACLVGFFDIPSYIFALISGIVASTVLKGAEKRMDLINAGLVIAAVNGLAVVVLLMLRAAPLTDYPPMLFWAALNGIVSGMLVLGVLPPLEYALNAATTFRLIELSDLNAPILRKLFTTAPGTYSHSIMVANLAEQACQDIGANALLARVGAYYHDIGKMDNPDYFVENQTDHNRHDDINPRLSATVIRSHVKLGVEKARGLGLPADVIDIVAEHHGNSLIMWFYKKASEQEDQVHSEDFSYPGSPPHSRESAVVMLADVTEAAVRTLIKPTVAKMEKFIQQLFDGKVENGQLAQSELTFHDLEAIKNAFVRVLASYYHSRIEYPKMGDDAPNGAPNGGDSNGASNGTVPAGVPDAATAKSDGEKEEE